MRLLGAPAAKALYEKLDAKAHTAALPGLLVYYEETDAPAKSYLAMMRKSCQSHSVPLYEQEAPKDTLVGGVISISKKRTDIPLALDVDGVSLQAGAALYASGKPDKNTPCTAEACIRLLDYYKIPLKGAAVTVIGRSATVGKPLALLLTRRDATVTLCHSKTVDLGRFTRQADILICASGAQGLITKEHVRKGQTLVNIGGDAVEEEIEPIVENLAPFRGGIGPLTTACLLCHCAELSID